MRRRRLRPAGLRARVRPGAPGRVDARHPRIPCSSSDPYDATSRRYLATILAGTVCGVVPQGDAGVAPRPYELVTYPSSGAAQAAGAIVTHFGHCGVCSTLANLAVYMTQNDLTAPVRACRLADRAYRRQERRRGLPRRATRVRSPLRAGLGVRHGQHAERLPLGVPGEHQRAVQRGRRRAQPVPPVRRGRERPPCSKGRRADAARNTGTPERDLRPCGRCSRWCLTPLGPRPACLPSGPMPAPASRLILALVTALALLPSPAFAGDPPRRIAAAMPTAARGDQTTALRARRSLRPRGDPRPRADRDRPPAHPRLRPLQGVHRREVSHVARHREDEGGHGGLLPDTAPRRDDHALAGVPFPGDRSRSRRSRRSSKGGTSREHRPAERGFVDATRSTTITPWSPSICSSCRTSPCRSRSSTRGSGTPRGRPVEAIQARAQAAVVGRDASAANRCSRGNRRRAFVSRVAKAWARVLPAHLLCGPSGWRRSSRSRRGRCRVHPLQELLRRAPMKLTRALTGLCAGVAVSLLAVEGCGGNAGQKDSGDDAGGTATPTPGADGSISFDDSGSISLFRRRRHRHPERRRRPLRRRRHARREPGATARARWETPAPLSIRRNAPPRRRTNAPARPTRSLPRSGPRHRC